MHVTTVVSVSLVYAFSQFECNLLMQTFYSKPLPVPSADSSNIICILNDRRIFFYVCPRDDRLNHDYFSTLISCLSPAHIVHIFESMLRSKRILCFSSSLPKLTRCCLALSLLIYPLVWPYSFVSVMPSPWLYDLLDSPCPYIYGCLHETMPHLSSTLDEEMLRVDLDANTIDGELDDEVVLPVSVRQTLQTSLEYIVRFRLGKPNSNLINIAVSEACIGVFIELFNHLPDYFHRLKQTSSTEFQRQDSGIDLQSTASNSLTHISINSHYQSEAIRLGYEFHSDEFLISQPTSSYVNFLNDFIHGRCLLRVNEEYQTLYRCCS
jgi:hypothetical protein